MDGPKGMQSELSKRIIALFVCHYADRIIGFSDCIESTVCPRLQVLDGPVRLEIHSTKIEIPWYIQTPFSVTLFSDRAKNREKRTPTRQLEMFVTSAFLIGVVFI